MSSIHEDLSALIGQFFTFESGEYSSFCKYSKGIAEKVESKDISLLNFIQKLGDKITSEDDEERRKAIHCLSETLRELKKSSLSKQDINVLLEFLLNKFDDALCFKHIIQAVTSLVQFNQFNPNLNNNLEKILKGIIEHYDSSKFLARVRYELFNVLQTLLNTFQDVIVTNKEYHDLFVRTFIHVSTGEKDPRNLLSSFKLNRDINKAFTFDISVELEKTFINDLFDNAFCYFPISFKPPPNDPYHITSEQLKAGLRTTLASQDLFSKDLFNSLFEKLTSTNPVIRNDVLSTFLLAVESFHFETLLEYWEYLWNGLKFEILHFENPNFFDSNQDYFIPENFTELEDTDENKSIYLVMEIIRKLTSKLQLEALYLEFITKDLKDDLSINSKYFKQAIVLLSNIASTSEDAFNYVHEFIFKQENLGRFLSLEDQEDQDLEEDVALTVKKQRGLIDGFGYIFVSYQIVTKDLDNYSLFYASNYLNKIKENLTIFLGQLLQSSSNIEKTLKCKIIQQYVKLIQLKKFLKTEERKLIVNILNDMFVELIKINEKDIVLEEIINGFVNLISLGDEEINNLIIDIFLPQLLQNLTPEASPEQVAINIHVLNKTVINYKFLEIVAIRLTNRLSAENIAFNKMVLNLIVDLVLKIQGNQQFSTNSWFNSFIPNLFKNIHYENLEPLSETVGLVIKYASKTKHQEILNCFVDVFYKGLPDSKLKLQGYTLLEKPDLIIIIFNKVLSNIDKSTQLSISQDDLSTLFTTIIDLDDKLVKIHYLQHLSLLINKFFNDDEFLDSKLQEFYNTDDANKFELSIWIIKSLVLKLNKVGLKYLKINLDALDTTKSQALILKSFDIILKDLKIFEQSKELPKGTKLISQVQPLNVKLLYKQQVFNLVITKILDNEANNVVYLTLLAILSKNVDSTILKFKIYEIIPLIIKSLKLDNLLDTSLETLLVIVETDNLSDHLPFLTKRLVELSSTKIFSSGKLVNNEKIRYLALNCLLNLLKRNDKNVVLAYKQDIISSLVKDLDDPKRSVRKLASDIRQYLFELRD